jgi:F0F1-type ATP synthase alpha subunit
VKRLETDLSIARQAESVLETQKQENLALKETIDRMRFDLDEARMAVANVVAGSHLRSGTNGSSVPQTMSRNLGDELSRRLVAADTASAAGKEDEDGDSIVETVVTTQRRRVGPSHLDRNLLIIIEDWR